jgi:hypothetical protein
MATKKATKKSTTRTASKPGAKKSSKSGRKGSKGGKKMVMGEPIIVGGGGGKRIDVNSMFIDIPNKFRGDNSNAARKHFYSNDRRIPRVRISGDLEDYDETSDSGDCQIEIWFSGL